MRAPKRTLLGLVLLATAAQADVVVVDQTGGGDHVDLQAAVDAAADGDVLLIHDGAYAAPLIAARSLALVAQPGANVRVDGVTDVLAVASGQVLVLSGLQLVGALHAPALRVTACAGAVRIQDCVVRGADAPAFVGATDAPGQFAAGPGVCVHACDDVAFVGCTLSGGAGGAHVAGSALGAEGGVGRDALEASAAVMTLERCTLTGGAGGSAHFGGLGGIPGAGLSHFGLELVAARCLARGGSGAAGDQACSDGAPGARLAGTAAAEFGCTFVGGAAGPGCAVGAGLEGALASLRGAQRGLAAPRVVAAGASFTLELSGRPGDSVRVFAADETARQPRLDAGGVWTLSGPLSASPPAGPLPGSGSLSVPLTAPSVAPGDARMLFLQAIHDPSQGPSSLSNAAILIVLGA